MRLSGCGWVVVSWAGDGSDGFPAGHGQSWPAVGQAWLAMAGRGPPWPAMDGHGQPKSAMAETI